MKRMILVLAAGLAGLCLAAGNGAAGDPLDYWSSWRGPLDHGLAPRGNPPLEWSETKNVRWKVPMPGPGHATPVVWGDRIFVLSAVETEKTLDLPESGSAASGPETVVAVPASQQQTPPPRRRREPPPAPTHVHQFVVSALDRNTGASIWNTVVAEEVPHESGHATASQASASPVTDGEHVWASFGSRGIYCLDWSGKVIWGADLGDMSTRNQFGEGASPVLHGDMVVVNWDHEGDSFIVGLDKRTGKERWRAERDEPTSWSTPLVVEDGGRPLAIVSATNRVRAYDVRTGEEVWKCGGLGLNCIPTPVADKGLVFVMSGYREAAGMAIRYEGAKGDLTDGPSVVWRLDSGMSYVPSPLLYDGKLYLLERFKGMLSCRDFGSGEPCYEQQRLEGLGNIYASLVGAKGRVYVLDRNGAAIVFRHGDTFEILARNQLDDAFDASPVIVGNDLYLRGHEHLYNLRAM